MKRYAVIGHPIGHTMSPFIHKKLFEISGIYADYGVYDIAPEKLERQFLDELKNLNGFNVTIPFKQQIIPLLTKIDSRAQLYGSVNTVHNTHSGSKGFTTDPDGFTMALEAEQIPRGGRAVVLGCGGVARTMAYELIAGGASLEFAVRKEDRELCKQLVEEIRGKRPQAKVDFCPIEAVGGDIDLLVNATPVGMSPNINACPVSDKVISRSAAVFDAVYNPLETVLVKKAKANGGKAAGGMSMLVYQAAKAHKIWEGVVYEKDAVDKICVQAAQELANR